MRLFFRKSTTLLALLFSQVVTGSPLKSDEEVILFPTSARHIDGNRYEIDVHAWVFEAEVGSLSQKIKTEIISELLEFSDITEQQTHSEIFLQRIKWFLVDSERNKVLTVKLNDKDRDETSKTKFEFKLNKTQPNGHSYTSIQTNLSGLPGSWRNIRVVVPDNKTEKRVFTGQFQLIPDQGISIISDIDDTIKISQVLDKNALIRHTFAEAFKLTDGTPRFYKRLLDQGTYFHYVSSSPWQLYPPLSEFIYEHYPYGSISLRPFRLKDSSIIDFLKSSKDYKLDTIRSIIHKYPEHQFILMGDSGENDPEIYAQIATEFPQNIDSILIRQVDGSEIGDFRFNIMNGLSIRHWQLFKDAAEISYQP